MCRFVSDMEVWSSEKLCTLKQFFVHFVKYQTRRLLGFMKKG